MEFKDILKQLRRVRRDRTGPIIEESYVLDEKAALQLIVDYLCGEIKSLFGIKKGV